MAKQKGYWLNIMLGDEEKDKELGDKERMRGGERHSRE